MSALAHPQRAVNEFVFGRIDSTAFWAFRRFFIPIPRAFRRIRFWCRSVVHMRIFKPNASIHVTADPVSIPKAKNNRFMLLISLPP
jgi:hypothetical protein